MKLRENLTFPIKLFIGIIVYFTLGCSSSNPIEKEPEPIVPTTGLAVNAITTNTGGNFTPYNVVAIWIENSAGEFVKSLTVYAIVRRYELSKWFSSSAGNLVDAKTGATKSSFGTITGYWNGKDTKGAIVPDGKYTLWLEISDKGGMGNASSFTFTKGVTTEILAPENAIGFSNINIKWMPL